MGKKEYKGDDREIYKKLNKLKDEELYAYAINAKIIILKRMRNKFN